MLSGQRWVLQPHLRLWSNTCEVHLRDSQSLRYVGRGPFSFHVQPGVTPLWAESPVAFHCQLVLSTNESNCLLGCWKGAGLQLVLFDRCLGPFLSFKHTCSTHKLTRTPSFRGSQLVSLAAKADGARCSPGRKLGVSRSWRPKQTCFCLRKGWT